MNIIALVPDAFGGKGGIAQYLRDVLTALSESDNVSRIVTVVRNPSSYTQECPNKIALHYPRGGKFRYALHTLRATRNVNNVDLILCGHLNLLPIAWLLNRFTGAPVMQFIYGIDAWLPPASYLVRRLAPTPAMTVSISDLTRQRFAHWVPDDVNRIKILNNCIRLNQYGLKPKAEMLLARYEIGARPVIMTIARLNAAERYKGIDEVLECLPGMKREVPALLYFVVGEGDDRARLENKAQSLDLQDDVIFTGWVDDDAKQQYLSIADVFAMPGSGEGFGFVYLEAMACGVPVVASTLDGSREAVLHGTLGEMVDPNDGAALQAAILRCLKKEKSIPPGLEQFDYPNFKQRLYEILLETTDLSAPLMR